MKPAGGIAGQRASGLGRRLAPNPARLARPAYAQIRIMRRNDKGLSGRQPGATAASRARRAGMSGPPGRSHAAWISALTTYPIDGHKLALCTAVARRDLGVLLRELGKNAYDAGAANVRVIVERDAAGRAEALEVSHDGTCLTRDELESFLRTGVSAPRGGDRKALGRLGLGLLILASNSQGLEFRCPHRPLADFAFAVNLEDRSATVHDLAARVRARRGLPASVKVVGITPELKDEVGHAVRSLQALPLGSGFSASIDESAGLAPVAPRTYAGTLLRRGALEWAGGDARGPVRFEVRYELRLLDAPLRGPRRTQRGVGLVRDGFELLRTTLGLPVRSTEIQRLTGWFEIGDWLEIDAATLRPLTRSGPTRSFFAAARNLVNECLAGVEKLPEFINPDYLAKLSSELTQRLGKAIHADPRLAPVIDVELAPARHRSVLDIPFRQAGQGEREALRSTSEGVRVGFSLEMAPDGDPAIWDAERRAIVLNARHSSAVRTPGGQAAFETWSVLAASLILASLRPGGAGLKPALRDGLLLAGAAYATASAPTSTRSQRERRKRREELQRLKAQVPAT